MATKFIKCCICGKVIEDITSHNAEPYKQGRCCSECNSKVVLPARMNLRLKEGNRRYKK